MAHTFDPEDRHKLDTPERRSDMPPEQTLVTAGIKPGDTILDVGCGTGYFTFPAARMVGHKGMVYAVDISGVMLADLRSKAASSGIFNIETSQISRHEPKFPDAPYTLVILSNVLHEVDDKPEFLSALAAALKPGTRLSVIEWEKKQGEKGPPVSERLSEDEMQVLLKKAGFTEPDSQRLGRDHLLYTCLKKEEAA